MGNSIYKPLNALERISGKMSVTFKLVKNINIRLADECYKEGIQNIENEKYDAARLNFLKAIELNEDSYIAFLQLIALDIDTEDYEEALLYAKQAITKFGEDSALYYAKGVINSSIEEYHSAIEDFSKVIELEKVKETSTEIFHDSYEERAKAKAKIGDHEGSKQDYFVMGLRKKAWRIRHEGLNEEEQRLFGV